MMHDDEKMIRHAMMIAKHLASGGHVHLTHRKHFESGGESNNTPDPAPAPAPAPEPPKGLDPNEMKGEPLDWAHLHLPDSFTRGFQPNRQQNTALPPSITGTGITAQPSTNPTFNPMSYAMPDMAPLAQPPRTFARGGYATDGAVSPMGDTYFSNDSTAQTPNDDYNYVLNRLKNPRPPEEQPYQFLPSPSSVDTIRSSDPRGPLDYTNNAAMRHANRLIDPETNPVGNRRMREALETAYSLPAELSGAAPAYRAGAAIGRSDLGEAALEGTGAVLSAFPGAPKLAMAMVPAAKGAAKVATSAASPVVREAETVLKNAQLPNLRTMPIQDALAIAREEPHLIPAAKGEESAYVGGPRNVKSKEDLEAVRNRYDTNVGQDYRGWDWYDRYRDDVNQVTGGNPLHNEWMANQEGQWSAGVDPGSEVGFSIKENNGALTGFPVKASYPAQHQAHMRAIAANDPSLYQLGEKTGEYAEKINPDKNLMPTATGVNDFRHARELGYTEANGEPQRGALGSTQHTFADYETALAVDRANKTQLGGRTDWTGEQMQAAPWVRQKAMDILDQRPNMIAGYIKQGMTPEAARAAAYEDAFQLANRTIGDFYNKHTAFATHEAFPGADTGHMPQSVGASQALRDIYSIDPRSTWATAPNNRDAVYSGLQLGDTGVAARVRPTTEMTGMYTPPSGITEQNMGEVARPLVGINTDKLGTKSLPEGDRAMLTAGETLRAAIDAQNAGAAHVNFVGGRPESSNSFFLPMNRKATPEEILAVQQAGAKNGLTDVVDTGQGLTSTRFYPPPPILGKDYTNPIGPTMSGLPMESNVTQKAKDVAREIMAAAPQADTAMRTTVDSVYADLVDKWQQGIGSGAVTREVLDKINVTPEMRQIFDTNPYIAQNALDRVARDEAFASQMGATRQDIQNFRRIIGDGPGWVGRLEEGLKNGAVLPALAAVVLGATGRSLSDEQQ